MCGDRRDGKKDVWFTPMLSGEEHIKARPNFVTKRVQTVADARHQFEGDFSGWTEGICQRITFSDLGELDVLHRQHAPSIRVYLRRSSNANAVLVQEQHRCGHAFHLFQVLYGSKVTMLLTMMNNTSRPVCCNGMETLQFCNACCIDID